MTTHIKTALALMTGVVLGGVGFGALRAQTKAQPAYWVTEVLEMRDQAAFMKAIQAVPPTVQNFGGRYIVLGGKLTADIGPVPKRIAIVAFDSMDKAQGMVERPHGPGAARRSQQTRPDARLCRRGGLPTRRSWRPFCTARLGQPWAAHAGQPSARSTRAWSAGPPMVGLRADDRGRGDDRLWPV